MISCIILDDEPLALEQLEKYVKNTPILELKGVFDTTIDALSFLRENSVDLLFVDINMPHISGLEFVEALPFDIKVIFITAYREYALEGFALDAADYLLKPISYATFTKSVEKVYNRYFNRQECDTKDKDYMFIRSHRRLVRVNFCDIQYIESKKEYLDIVLSSSQVLTTHGTLQKVSDKLPSDTFIKVHRSFIVNLKQITVVERNAIIFGKQYIPITESAREIVMNYINA